MMLELTDKLQSLLEETQQSTTHLNLLDKVNQTLHIPDFNLQVNNPHLLCQTSAKDKKFDSYTTQNKCMFHLECCKTAAPFILHLFCNLKENRSMQKCFGKYIHITKCLTLDACSQDCVLLCHMAPLHTNYHNVQLHSISSIVSIMATAKIGRALDHGNTSIYPTKTLCNVLYELKLGDKSPLFLTILPCPGGFVINCVIPNTTAAKTKLVQMNHHFPGYLKFHLTYLGYNHNRVVTLINKACDPDLTATISQLDWNPQHKVVILPAEAELELDLDTMENKPWIQAYFLSSLFPSPCKKAHNDPNHVFLLNSDLSVTTIHANKSGTESPQNNLPTPLLQLHIPRKWLSLTPVLMTMLVHSPP